MPSVKPTRVPAGDRFGGWLQEHCSGLLLWLADMESRVLREELAASPVRAPIWIAGLARSGSTKLLEILSGHAALTSHRYADFAGLFTPWWWNWLRSRALRKPRQVVPVERSHADRILVTDQSPEAFEEPLWMAHFPGLHATDAAQRSAVFDGADSHPRFERRLREHIGKLLHARGAARYLAKANYHLPRLAYLLRQYPDARFVVPVRHPLTHIGSLVKQDRLLSEMGAANAGVRRQLRRAGHFEFGLDKRVPNLGEAAQAREDFARGDVAAGYARIWNSLYGHLLQQLQADAKLAAAVLVVPYEQLCAQPQQRLQQLFAHVGLHDAQAAQLIARHAGELSEPVYYRNPLDAPESERVMQLTAPARAGLGY